MWDNIALAFSSLRSNKMRALLTMLGIIIGIGAVIAIQTVGDTLTSSVSDSFSSMGTNNITVSLTEKNSDYAEETGTVDVRMFGPSTPTDADLITDTMVAEYRAAFPRDVTAVYTHTSVGTGSLVRNSETYSVSLIGAGYDYLKANDVTPLYGRALTERDNAEQRMVAVVADKFVTDIGMQPLNAIGQSFTVKISSGGGMGGIGSSTTTTTKSYTFYIVGVYEYESSSNSSMSWFSDDTATNAYIPLSTANFLTGTADGYQDLTVVTSTSTDSDSFLTTTGNFFASYYTRNASYTVEATSLASMMETLTSTLNSISLGISAIAAISLMVGGIGVMNIMLVSITERTREIGVRKALGARRRDIRLQFITESVVICLVGGAIGIGVGIALGSAASSLVGGMMGSGSEGFMTMSSVSVDPVTVLIAESFSMAIGVFFGYYPANKAAKLDPIEALRYE